MRRARVPHVDQRSQMEAQNSMGVTLHRNCFLQEALFCYSNAMNMGKEQIGQGEFAQRRMSDINLPSFLTQTSNHHRKLRPTRGSVNGTCNLSEPCEIDLSIGGPHSKFLDFMTVLHNIATLHFQLGSLQIAENLLRMALSWIQEGDQHQYTSSYSSVFLLMSIYHTLGNVMFFRGEHDQLSSFDMYMEALHLGQEFIGTHYLVAEVLNSLGRVMCRSTDWRGGLEAYREALRIYNSVKFCVEDYVETNSFCAGAA